MTYDANGNLTGDGVSSYIWDRANRLTSDGSVSYSYDGLGNRTHRMRGLGTTEYLLDLQSGLTQVLAEQTTGGNPLRYVHGPRFAQIWDSHWLY